MKWGGEQQSTHGFTIVETMIVLAVTGTLFVLAVFAVSGSQNRTDFNVGSRKIAQDIQRIVNETESGYYSNTEDFTCRAQRAAPSRNNVRITGGSTAQGQNSECIFGGKVLAFSGTNPQEFSVYSLAGRRLDSAGDPVQSPGDAWLTVIPSSTQTLSISNGLEYIGAVYSATPGSRNVSGIATGFLSNFEQSQYGAGAQQLQLYATSANWPAGTASGAGESYLNSEADIGAASYPVATSTLQLCFRSGGTNQSAIVNITPALSVSMDIKNDITCGGMI